MKIEYERRIRPNGDAITVLASADFDRMVAALEKIAHEGGVGPYEPPRKGHMPDPWYNSLVRCGEIAKGALDG